MDIKNVTVLGAGVLGAQIAFQIAYAGFNVISYDIDEGALVAAVPRFDRIAETYAKHLSDATPEKLEETRQRIKQTADLVETVAQADFITESVPERLDIKQALWEKVGNLAPKHTIFTTNTSTILPSEFSAASGDESRFLALHFANDIWQRRIVEVMGTDKTDTNAFEATYQFAQDMGMLPVRVKKEQAGYIMNSLLVPLLEAASRLYGNEVADPSDVDKTWKLATGAPIGPFEIMDIVGLRTVYAVHSAKADKTGDDTLRHFAEVLKTEFLEKGKTGKESGKGFYDYDV